MNTIDKDMPDVRLDIALSDMEPMIGQLSAIKLIVSNLIESVIQTRRLIYEKNAELIDQEEQALNKKE